MIEMADAIVANIGPTLGGILIGFAIGSVPFGYLLVRLKTGDAVRRSGSGNIGATNVGRVLGPAGGVATLLLDAAKGVAGAMGAGYVGALLGGPSGALWTAAGALGAVLGHCYTPWLGGRGGKGVATLLGAFGWVAPATTAIGGGVLLLTLAVSRMMSAASLCGSLTLAVAAWWRGEPRSTAVAASIAVLVIVWRHRSNISRIIQRQERRLGGAGT